ncbi:lamin tail domain-containing protein [Aquimarina sp. MMG015]|uniref:lamin tail domain-containing protein n=1 Tax=Aquimarina sp. MMG015 TaxID=2822689 RepID=UPI001B3A611C|nr:T9SS type A sorting domain-containing protein [Aquimarina sp. MMG015]MBQ4804349.1 lamin tail domain-containing protein [Aquimarina sp. MMG015]
MKKLYFLFFTITLSLASYGQTPVITAIVDGDCSGGLPKLLEIYADGMVDFSLYSLENQTNNSTTWGNTQDLSTLGIVTDGFVYISTSGSIDGTNGNPSTLGSEFPSLASATVLASNTINVNGDDRIRIILNSSGATVDQYGVDNTDGSGTTWEYTDSYAKRVDGTGPDAGFTEVNWTIPGSGTLNNLGTCQGGTDTFETLIGGIGTYSTTVSTTPTINVSGAVSGLDYFEANGPSNEGTFTVSGLNLTTDLTITAPANFEVSLTTGSGFASSVAITPAMGTIATTTIYTRLVAGLTSNSYTGDATVSSTGATDQTVMLSGTVSPADPQFTVSGFIGDFSYFEGSGPSTEDSFNVEGLFLTGDITITAPTNFEVSLTTGTGFGSSVSIAPTTGTVNSTEIFVRMASGLTANSYTGDITVSSPSVTDETISLNGTVSPVAVCANVGDIIITEIMQNPSAAGNDPNGEYFEVYNTTGSAIDIQSWIIKDDNQAGETHVIGSSLIVPPMGYVLITNAATPNGGITPDYTYANDISLGNSTDGIIIECGSTVIDQVIWDNGATFPDPTGASMELSINDLNSVANDDGANWAEAVTAFGSGDLGTPGDANDNASTLSVDDFDEKLENFNMFPNPTNTGFVNITTTSNSATTVSVFDMLGKQVISETLNNNLLNVSNLNAGIYLIRLDQTSGSVTKKLVIE